MADKETAPEVKKVRVTVSARRTVRHDGKLYLPGQSFALPAAEAKRLRGLGFLVDPGAEAAPVAEGPTFSETVENDGASVSVQ